jgi:hypothetical protein
MDEHLHSSNESIGQGLKRQPEGRAETCDIVPIETNRQESQTLIPIGTAKQVGEDEAVLIGQTEDREADEHGEQIFGKYFPHEQSCENHPENLHALFVASLVSMESLQHGGDRKVFRVEHLGGPEQSSPHHSSHSISNDYSRVSICSSERAQCNQRGQARTYAV